jgi:hypothetical protein
LQNQHAQTQQQLLQTQNTMVQNAQNQQKALLNAAALPTLPLQHPMPHPIPVMPQPAAFINHASNPNNNNSWFPLPSFFNNNTTQPKPQIVQPMFDFNSGANNNNSNNNNNDLHPPQQLLHHSEEKANTLDDDMVLEWTNDHGLNNPFINEPGLLKTKQVIGGGKCDPGEVRQCGWLLQNMSKVGVKLSCTLVEETNETEHQNKNSSRNSNTTSQICSIQCKPEKLYEFSLNPKEEVFVLMEVTAPPCVGNYCKFFRLRMRKGGYKIGEILEVVCQVKAKFSVKREKKIEQIVKMGFNDRKKVVTMLLKYKWNVEQAINKIVTTQT